MLAASGAKTIAANDADAVDPHRDALDSRLQRLTGEHEGTRWYQRTRRADLERQIAACRRELRTAIAAAPERPEASGPRPGRDPLAGLERDRGRGHGHGHGHGLGREL